MHNSKGGHHHNNTTSEETLPGKLLLLGEDLDKQVEDYIKYLHECSTAVNTAVVIAEIKTL